MVRQMNIKRHLPRNDWKAALAIIVAAGALLWHVLACTESPMAFSPDGERLALVTMEPYNFDGDPAIAGTRAYRLMAIEGFKTLRVIEQTTSPMLSGPAWSPDGKALCYLRIPLMTLQELEALANSIEKRRDEIKQAFNPPDMQWPTGEAATQPATAPAGERTGERAREQHHHRDYVALPDLEAVYDLFTEMLCQPAAPAQLVVRDAESSAVTQTVTVRAPLYRGANSPLSNEDSGMDPLIAYTTIRPSYSPDGKSVYFCAGNMAIAVNLSDGKQHVLASPASVALLSPGGKTLAVVQENALAFVKTDGSVTTYRRWNTDLEMLGALAWRDDQTLAVIGEAKGNSGDHPAIRFLKTDGSDAGSIKLDLPETPSDHEPMALAVAPDGKHMVVCFEENAFFLNDEGKILNHWQVDHEILAQPTFTPDSNCVAMKHMKTDSDEQARVVAAVLYTVEGKEIARVAVPAIAPGTTRPASMPTTTPAE